MNSLMAEDFISNVKNGKLKNFDLETINGWVSQWCYDHLDEGEYNDQTIDADTEDMYKLVVDECTGLPFDEYKQYLTVKA